MGKVVEITISNCLECPNCVKAGTNAPYRIQRRSECKAGGGPRGYIADKLNKRTPIPEWCPLPDEGEVATSE